MTFLLVLDIEVQIREGGREITGPVSHNSQREGSFGLRFHLPSFNTSMISKGPAIVGESCDDVGEIIVEFAARVKIGDDLLVFEVCVFEFLESLFTLFRGRITTARGCESGIRFFDPGGEL